MSGLYPTFPSVTSWWVQGDFPYLVAYNELRIIFFFSWRYNPHWGLYFTAL